MTQNGLLIARPTPNTSQPSLELSCLWAVSDMVRHREMGTPLMGTILIRASGVPRKIGTLLLGSWWP